MVARMFGHKKLMYFRRETKEIRKKGETLMIIEEQLKKIREEKEEGREEMVKKAIINSLVDI